MKKYNVTPLPQDKREALQQKIDGKTKPLGSLGKLETVALQIGMIQDRLEPSLMQPHMLVFAGDHGIAEEGISPFPKEVTRQMVMNFMEGGAAINVFCKQHGIKIRVVDAGIDGEMPQGMNGLIHNKIANGTANFLKSPAMELAQAEQALETSGALVHAVHEKGCNIIGFGEMGIGNTSAASLLMHLITGIPLATCVGRGAGLNDAGLNHKLQVLGKALEKWGELKDPLQILATFGGFEIAQMAGGMLQAAADKMIILIDGFIATAACLVAQAMAPAVKEYCIFSHQSNESGHIAALQYLGADPLLKLDLRLGEGTGAALAYPLIQSAVNFLSQMASFESANVSGKTT